MRKIAVLILTAVTLGACSPKAETYTLYRNSSFDLGARVHWATFNAGESDPNYNADNCNMAARLLNANLEAHNGPEITGSRGFWCEPGGYESEGPLAPPFVAQFPTDT